jgi:hypothetical protein
MVQEIYISSMIAPVAIAGVLILAVLITIPSNALMTHSSSEYEKCVKSSKNCFLLNNKSSKTENGATSQESSKTENGATSQESSKTGKVAQESNTGQSSAPVRPAITITPHITTTTHNQELSKNGILPKLTLAPKPTGPALAPRLIGTKTIAEAQEAKLRGAEQAAKFGVSLEELNNAKQWFDPKTQDCEGKRISSQLTHPGGVTPPSGIDVTGKLFCSGKVFSREGGTVYNTKNEPRKIVEREQKAMHPSLTAFLPKTRRDK